MHFYCYLAPSFVPSLSTATSTSTSTTSTSFTPWGRELTLKSRRAVAAVWGGGWVHVDDRSMLCWQLAPQLSTAPSEG